MRKLFPLACVTLFLTACSASEWGGCQDKPCCQSRESLSERSWGSMRGNRGMTLQYSDQDYKGKKGCDGHRMNKAEQKSMKKYAHKASAIEPAAASIANAPAEKPRKRGLFF